MGEEVAGVAGPVGRLLAGDGGRAEVASVLEVRASARRWQGSGVSRTSSGF